MTQNKLLGILSTILVLTLPATIGHAEPSMTDFTAYPPFLTVAPKPNVLILLDNSGSMSGLIEQAKSELWRVVNELTTARQNGQLPRLQVALYTYGDPPPRQLNALTDDLDKVYEKLFDFDESLASNFCFSPDGSTMFVNIQYPGMTLAITGDWSQFVS